MADKLAVSIASGLGIVALVIAVAWYFTERQTMPLPEDSLITKTKGIEETEFFLSQYPDAEVQVKRYPEDHAEVIYRVERPVNPPEELRHWPKTHSLSLWFEMTQSTGEIKDVYAECGSVATDRATTDIIGYIVTTDCLNPNWDNVDYGQNEE